jgi:hypothetical protein
MEAIKAQLMTSPSTKALAACSVAKCPEQVRAGIGAMGAIAGQACKASKAGTAQHARSCAMHKRAQASAKRPLTAAIYLETMSAFSS